jgi:hypothetical protein
MYPGEDAMKRFLITAAGLMVAAAVAVVAMGAAKPTAKPAGKAPEWEMNATAIEACSCPVFCQCYFNTAPAGHDMANMPGMEGHAGHEEHYCRFNNAYKVNHGTYKGTKLDGARFWIYGDLGGDFSKGQMDWAVVTFDKSVTPDQRAGIGAICSHLFPVKWGSLKTAEGDIDWVSGKDAAYATLDGGKTAEVRLKRFKGMNDGAVVIKNLPYWGATQNDGFVIMPNETEVLHTGDKPFEYSGTNGFMITLDIDADHAPPAPGN